MFKEGENIALAEGIFAIIVVVADKHDGKSKQDRLSVRKRHDYSSPF